MLKIWNDANAHGSGDENGASINNALWDSRSMTRYSSMPFSMSMANNQDGVSQATVNDFVWQAQEGKCIEVLGGLLLLQFTHSSTTASLDAIKDEYHIQVGVEVEGWTEW